MAPCSYEKGQQHLKIHIYLEKFYLLFHKHLKGIKAERKSQHFQSVYFAHLTSQEIVSFIFSFTPAGPFSVLQCERCTKRSGANNY